MQERFRKEWMYKMGNIILTLFIALIGGILATKLKIPAGAFIGSMVLVAIVQGSGFQLGSFPSWTRFLIQIILGAVIGLSINPDVIHELKEIALPAVIIVFTLVITSVITGVVISKVSNLDIVTALFGSAPGGMTDMVLISSVLGADAAKVAALHLIRLISLVIFLPLIIRVLVK